MEMTLQMSPRAEFGLLAWLMKEPARIQIGPFPAMLFLAKMHFREPRAQWLAKEIILTNGDQRAIEQDAYRYRQEWFPGFQREAEKEGFAKCPEELHAKLIKHIDHPEFKNLL